MLQNRTLLPKYQAYLRTGFREAPVKTQTPEGKIPGVPRGSEALSQSPVHQLFDLLLSKPLLIFNSTISLYRQVRVRYTVSSPVWCITSLLISISGRN